jgi:hypothetical protein
MSANPRTLSSVTGNNVKPAKLSSSPSNSNAGDAWFSNQIEPLAHQTRGSSPHAVNDVFGISLNNSIVLDPSVQRSGSKYAIGPSKSEEADAMEPSKEGDEENPSPADEKEEEGGEGGAEEEEEEEARTCGDRCTSCQMLCAYHFDNWIAQRVNQMLLVVYAFLGTIVIMSPIFHTQQDEFYDPRYYNDSLQFEEKGFEESLWETYTCLMDPGPHMEMESTGQRVIGALISWFGVVIFSVLTGFVIDAVMEKMEDLKKGRSTVIESEHTLILGWTDKAAGLCREIANANESEGGGVIVRKKTNCFLECSLLFILCCCWLDTHLFCTVPLFHFSTLSLHNCFVVPPWPGCLGSIGQGRIGNYFCKPSQSRLDEPRWQHNQSRLSFRYAVASHRFEPLFGHSSSIDRYFVRLWPRTRFGRRRHLASVAHVANFGRWQIERPRGV